MSNSKLLLKNQRKGSLLPNTNIQIQNTYVLNQKSSVLVKNNSEKIIGGSNKKVDKSDVDCTFLDFPKIQKRTLKIIGNHDFFHNANIQSNKTIKVNTQEYKPYYETSSETNKKIQLLTTNRSVIIEKDRVSMQLQFFRNLLDEYNNKINKLQQENTKLKDLQNRFQTYLSSMNENRTEDYEQNSNSQKQYRMKILNLQNKIQTLNFIIKQYRNSNKEQIKKFEKKLSQYKPNIEAELTNKLKEVTEKYTILEKQMKYLREQCKIQSKDFSWDILVTNYIEQIENLQKYEQINFQQKIKIKQLQEKTENLTQLETQRTKMQQNIQSKLKQIEQLKNFIHNCEEKNKQYETKIGEYEHSIEQLQFKLEEVNAIKNTLTIKEEILKSNKIYITKLQSQNLTLKSKNRSFLLKNEEKLSSQQQTKNIIIKNLQNIDQYNQRFNENVKNFNDHQRQQKLAFICHLMIKINYCYEEIMHSYIEQIQLLQCQNEDLKLISEQHLDQKIKNKSGVENIYSNLKQTMDKFQRCVNSSTLINTKNSCCQCNHWIAHFGQLSNLLTINFQKLTQAKSSLSI